MKLSRLFCLFLLTGFSPIASAQQTTAAYPYEPAQLLLALPVTPADWTLIRSDADTSLGQWLLTKATRVFQAPPLSITPASAAPVPPGEVRISVVDTGGFAPSLADFADFKPAKSGPIEKKFVESLPAIVFTDDDGHQFTQVLVASRYLVEIAFTNLPQPRLEDWLRTFHFDQLPPQNDAPAASSLEFRLSHLDELHPDKNRSYVVSVTDPARLPKSEPSPLETVK